MAESAVSFLVEQLAAWIRSESELLGGIRENAERIRNEMGLMRAFLKVADEKAEVDNLLKEWVKQVREVAYDVEDGMDQFMLRFAAGLLYQTNRVFDKILEEVKTETPENLESMNRAEMKEFVHKSLKYKSYIIVLDDVWKLNFWEAIRIIFPRLGSHGCIMITTRFHDIGRAAKVDTSGYLYEIQPLPMGVAKMLFYNMAFMGSSYFPNHLGEVADTILKICDGLPLAIVVIGRLLATKDNIEE
ncbi:hypothetical protein BUALT_Bualt14G0006300 [Buddleja alternifolia]|uniref:Rx N-terminal domain-containing protein n=1 Tax=Buddleja alternifolia TaxID=168488 RepID=A0AAV6WMZ0_9LAMI|nr:hypothetical protein BUALT_Bualt14G0006300 [Buddleja alternifolia]